MPEQISAEELIQALYLSVHSDILDAFRRHHGAPGTSYREAAEAMAAHLMNTN